MGCKRWTDSEDAEKDRALLDPFALILKERQNRGIISEIDTQESK